MNMYLLAGWTGARRTLGARSELVTHLAFFLLIVLVLGSVWQAAVHAAPSRLGGYDLRALVWYVLFAEACLVPIPSRTIEEIGDEIGSGEIAVAMLRPASVLGIRMAMTLGSAAARQLVCLLAGGAATWVLVGPPHSAAALGLGLVACALGLACNVAAQHALGGIAFWLRDARSTWFLFQKLVLIAGGVLFPLDLLPPVLAAVTRPLPLAAMAYVPGRLASGAVEPAWLAFQALWLAVLLGAAHWVFQRGERRLQVLGG